MLMERIGCFMRRGLLKTGNENFHSILWQGKVNFQNGENFRTFSIKNKDTKTKKLSYKNCIHDSNK